MGTGRARPPVFDWAQRMLASVGARSPLFSEPIVSRPKMFNVLGLWWPLFILVWVAGLFDREVMCSACSGTGAPSYAAKQLIAEGFTEISASEIHDSSLADVFSVLTCNYLYGSIGLS